MATKIKLQVNHGKHAKQDSGQRLTMPVDQKNNQNKQAEQSKQVKQSPDKQKQKIKDKSPTVTKKQQPKKPKQKDKQKQQQNNKKVNPKQSPKKQLKSIQQKQNKVDKQLQTLKRIKEEQKKTKLTIDELIVMYKNSADDIFVNHGHNHEKQKVIQKKLTELAHEKQQRHKKIQMLQQKSIEKKKKKQQKQISKQVKNEEKAKQKRRKRAQSKLQSLNALSAERLKRQQQFQQYYNNEFKNKKFRFQQYQKAFQQKQKSFEQQMKQKILKNKQKYQPMDVQQMTQFLDNYQAQRWSMISQNKKKRQFNQQVLQSENKQFMSKLWKGECHRRVSDQRYQQKLQKNQAKTKLQKTKQYGTIVKDSFKPKVSQQKRNFSLDLSHAITNQFQQIDGKEYKKIPRQKYVNGVNQGLVLENLRKSLDHENQVKIGNQYLQFLKSLPKVKKDPNQSLTQPKTQQNPENVRRKTPSTTFKPKITKNPYYQNIQSQRITTKSATIDHKRIKDPQLFHYLMADFQAQHRGMQLQQKAIKYGRYNGILQLQEKHKTLNRKLVQGISQKLSILGKM